MKQPVAAVVLLLVTTGTGVTRAQSSTPERSQDSASFEVAAIKPADPGNAGTMIRFDPEGRLEATGVTLKLLIRVAYEVHDFQIVGLPAWAESDRFNVDAKAADTKTAKINPGNPSIMTDDERRAVETKLHAGVQTLLADRFNLQARRETREMPVYALVIASGGSKLKPATGSRGLLGGRGQMTGTGATLDMLIHLLSNATDRIVIDRTGLNGAYDFKLEWTPGPGEMGLAGGPPPPGVAPGGSEASAPAEGPSLFTAIQEQLGLRLEATKGPVEVVVVDHAEKPSAN
jgi:uncharacterized protein (TIGR03435 family)